MENLSYQRKATIMFAISTAMFFSSINQTIVGVALPRIIAKLGGMNYYTWVITIYLLTSTISTILVGKLSDIYGRKPFILSGIVIFMTGAFFSGTSQDIIHLIIYRGIQGTGAGIIMATAFTAIGDLFSPRERGRWIGVISAVFGISSILGPGFGGYIVDHMDWHWVFWMFLPFGFLAFFMILLLFPKTNRRKSESIDYPGSLFIVLTIVPMLLAFSWAGTKYPWDSSLILELFAFAIVSLALFIFVETRVKTPLLPLSLFKNSVVSLSYAIGFMMHAGMFGALMYMPFYVQGVKGISATYAGYVTMPMSIGMFALNAYSGRRMTKTGKYKKMALIGMFTMVTGMLLMVVMNNIPMAAISMLIFGCGLGLGMPVFMIAVQNAVDSKDLGVATASVQLFRNIGGTIGIAVLGTVLSTSMGTKIKALGGRLNLAGLEPAAIKKISQLKNPQILLDHPKLSAIQNSLPESLHPVFTQLIEALRGAMAASLANVFLSILIVLILAFFLTFFLKELPLRTTVHKSNSVNNIASKKESVP
ncbi:MDR family MFS transporter [Phosphitispora sp. TUW77]|uniref:MDR family MFS transporter n=1 Tax=Phosphitispora sp. TUW77 TaxID=3152361 RepID=UPI003AB139D9